MKPLPAIKVYRDFREVCHSNAAGRREYKARTRAMAERQNHGCAICSGHIDLYDITFDHQDGRGLSGGHRDDRIEIDGKWYNASLCADCNGDKGSKRYHWVEGKYIPQN